MTSITGQEIKLRREIVDQALNDPELLGNLVEVSANNEVSLAQRISRIRSLLPVETITVFVEVAQRRQRQSDLQTQVRQDPANQKIQSRV